MFTPKDLKLINRRSFLKGLFFTVVAAPAIVKVLSYEKKLTFNELKVKLLKQHLIETECLYFSGGDTKTIRGLRFPNPRSNLIIIDDYEMENHNGYS